MSLTITTNIASLIAQHNLFKNTINLNKTSERLASGYKINHASDDAAGLSISETLRKQIRGIQRAAENTQDGINLLNITEGSLAVIIENLQRIRELTVQAANDTNATQERTALRQEVNSRVQDIERVKQATTFNNIQILNGSVSSYILRTGPNADPTTNSLDISSALREVLQTFLGSQATAGALSNAYLSGTAARQFLDTLDNAIEQVIAQRCTLGALQTRLQSNDQNLTITKENMQSAEARIRNIDMAETTADYTKNQILQQASVTVMTQANSLPAIAIELLKQSMG